MEHCYSQLLGKEEQVVAVRTIRGVVQLIKKSMKAAQTRGR